MQESPLVQRYILPQMRMLRYLLRRVQYRLQFGRPEMPAFFANSFPKSGTHLLIQAVNGFSRLGPVIRSGLPAVTMFEGFSGELYSVEKVARQLGHLQGGDVGYGHVFADPELVKVLCRSGVATYFIYRDPRDVAVSHVHYVTDIFPGHIHHEYYANQLKDFDERLRVSILGRPELTEIEFPNIRERFEPYLAWLEQPEVLSICFEDFVQHKRETLERIITHAVERGAKFRTHGDAALDILENAIDPQQSPTFRSGKVGGWKDSFSLENKHLFKQVTGDLLVRLGYEENMDW